MRKNRTIYRNGTSASFAGRKGVIVGHSIITQRDGQPRLVYVLDIGDESGFYAPGRDVYVSLLCVSEQNLEVEL